MTEIQTEDKFSNLAIAWGRYEVTSFDDWVVTVSDCYFKSGLSLKMASNFLGVQAAELQAVLKLAELDDEDLVLLANLKPPSTTWFSLAAASTAGLKKAIDALLRAEGQTSPFLVVNDAIRTVEGPSKFERIASLSSESFGHASKKAQAYGLLNEKGIKALKGWQSTVRSGKTLTPAQMTYADGLLRELVTNGAITRKSKDDDVEICNAILDALGYE